MWMKNQILKNKESGELIIYLDFVYNVTEKKYQLLAITKEGEIIDFVALEYKETVIFDGGKFKFIIAPEFDREEIGAKILMIASKLSLVNEYDWEKGMGCFKIKIKDEENDCEYPEYDEVGW